MIWLSFKQHIAEQIKKKKKLGKKHQLLQLKLL